MAFRDDLEAAHARSTALEAQLAQERAAHTASLGQQRNATAGREAALQRRIAALETRLGYSRQVSPRQLRLVWLLPPLLVLALQGLALALAMLDRDAPAWSVAQLACVTAILITSWSWGRRGRLWPWLAGAALKALIVVAWGWGWWHPLYSGLDHPTYGTPLYFFWGAGFVLGFIVLVESWLIRAGLRPLLPAGDPPAPPSGTPTVGSGQR